MSLEDIRYWKRTPLARERIITCSPSKKDLPILSKIQENFTSQGACRPGASSVHILSSNIPKPSGRNRVLAMAGFITELTKKPDLQDKCCIDSHLLQRQCPLDNHLEYWPAPAACAGRFGRLPTEIQQMIFHSVDLQSLTVLRAVCRTTRRAVSNLPMYSILVSRAPQLIRAIMGSEVAKWYTVPQIYQGAITDPHCSGCGDEDFGTFVHLLSMKRVCFICSSLPTFWPRKAILLNRWDRRDEGNLRNALPVFRTMSGWPAGLEPTSYLHKRWNLVSRTDFEHVRASLPKAPHDDFDLRRSDNYWKSKQSTPLRAMTIVNVPYWRSGAAEHEGGLICTGCESAPVRPMSAYDRNAHPKHGSLLRRQRQHTELSFPDHIKECDRARLALERMTAAKKNGSQLSQRAAFEPSTESYRFKDE